MVFVKSLSATFAGTSIRTTAIFYRIDYIFSMVTQMACWLLQSEFLEKLIWLEQIEETLKTLTLLVNFLILASLQ